MTNKNIVQNMVNKSGSFVGSVFSGVGKFAKNVTGSKMMSRSINGVGKFAKNVTGSKMMRKSMRGGKRKGMKGSRSMRKTKKSSKMGSH